MQFENEYLTYKNYLKQSGNKNKNFNDYLLDYFKIKAVPCILRALNNDTLGILSRITNDLPDVHPELPISRIADQFITAVDFMNDEQQYKAQTLERWFYASITLITFLFLDRDGLIKDKFLNLLIGQEVKNQPLTSLQDVKHALYGNPFNQDRASEIAKLVVGSASVAISQIICSDPAVQTIEKYRDRAMGVPEDDIRLAKIQQQCNFEKLRDYMFNDYYLCRIKLFEIQRDFLVAVNNLLPEKDQIKDLQKDLNILIDRLYIHAPVAGTQAYNDVFNFYLHMMETTEKELKLKKPEISSYIDQFMSLSVKCIGDSAHVAQRKPILQALETNLLDLLNQMRASVALRPSH